jgi:hypothetical protein
MKVSSTDAAPPMPRRLKPLLIAVAGWGLATLLNIWKPIWLAAPWFTYTPAVYALLWLVWLIVFVYVVGWYASHRWASVAATGVLALQACLGCVLVQDMGIDLITLSVEQGSFPLDKLHCDDWSTLPGHTYLDPLAKTGDYRCTLCMGSSDVPEETIRTYLFRRFEGWPFMLLVNASTGRRAADPTRSPCSGVP